jgi:hypothetical protein
MEIHGLSFKRRPFPSGRWLELLLLQAEARMIVQPPSGRLQEQWFSSQPRKRLQ